MPTTRTLAVRFITLAALALGAAAALASLPVATPPAAPDALAAWWESVDTPAATIAIFRMVGLLLAGWLLCVSLLGLVAALSQSRGALSLVLRISPARLRRVALASTVALSASTPVLAWSAEPDDNTPVLRDLGPVDETRSGNNDADTTAPMLVDLGAPIGDADEGSPVSDDLVVDSASTDAAPADTWTVARGDHLWGVAAETLRDRGESVDDATTAIYWQQLIEQNEGKIGMDPDLIHPGMVLELPM